MQSEEQTISGEIKKRKENEINARKTQLIVYTAHLKRKNGIKYKINGLVLLSKAKEKKIKMKKKNKSKITHHTLQTYKKIDQ